MISIINRQEVVKLLGSMIPNADDEVLNEMADDVIIDAIPAIYAAVNKVISHGKNEAYFLEYKN